MILDTVNGNILHDPGHCEGEHLAALARRGSVDMEQFQVALYRQP